MPIVLGTSVDFFLESCSARGLALPGATGVWRNWQKQDGQVVISNSQEEACIPTTKRRLCKFTIDHMNTQKKVAGVEPSCKNSLTLVEAWDMIRKRLSPRWIPHTGAVEHKASVDLPPNKHIHPMEELGFRSQSHS